MVRIKQKTLQFSDDISVTDLASHMYWRSNSREITHGDLSSILSLHSPFFGPAVIWAVQWFDEIFFLTAREALPDIDMVWH